MKLKIEIKNRFTGKVLFEYENENNTIKDTLVKAVEQGADLRGAYLQGADLQGADLRGAYLQGAEIKSAIVFTGLYTYLVIPYITKENEKRIKMGCYDRSLQEWESDFWNNNNEFPNDGSLKSNQRLLAYETAKKWLELSAEDIKNKELAEQEV